MMDDLRLAAVAARVVAWHNRHPLARRISAAHVHAVGYVGLPFVGAVGEAGPLPVVAQAAAAEAGVAASASAASEASPVAGSPLPSLATLQADFSEDFIDPLRPQAVARFAVRAGQMLVQPPGDGPLREVLADGAHPGRQPARVYLLTAVIETRTRKSRVLLGTGPTAPVLGRRVFDQARVAALAGVAGLVVGVPAWLLQPADALLPKPLAAPTLAAWAPVATAATLPAPASAVTASAPASAPAPAAAASAPDQATLHVGVLPSIRPVISEEDKALARRAREALSAPMHAAASVSLAVTPPSAVPASVAQTFALSSRPLRTRAEAEQVQVAMRSLLRTVGEVDLKVDVLAQGDDWRVVALPFAQRAEADQARKLLVSRGMRVEVLDF